MLHHLFVDGECSVKCIHFTHQRVVAVLCMLHHLFVDGFIFDTDFCVAFYSAYFGFCNYY